MRRLLSGRWRSKRSARKFSLLTSFGTATDKISKIFTSQIGENLNRVSTIYATTFDGTATSANWSDLAERYHADDIYEEGTLLGVGGKNEVTLYQSNLPFAGVVSETPGLQLNTNEENRNDPYWPFICLKGRIPVKINGIAKKGDYIVVDDNGKGKSIGNQVQDKHNLIGISLEDGVDRVEVKI